MKKVLYDTNIVLDVILKREPHYAASALALDAASQGLVEGYLGERPGLRLAILLQDLRRDFSEDETLLLDWLAERGVPWQVVVSKADKLKPMRRAQRLAKLERQLDRTGPALLLTSSESRLGIDALWRVIRARVEPGPGPSRPSAESPT